MIESSPSPASSPPPPPPPIEIDDPTDGGLRKFKQGKLPWAQPSWLFLNAAVHVITTILELAVIIMTQCKLNCWLVLLIGRVARVVMLLLLLCYCYCYVIRKQTNSFFLPLIFQTFC